MSETLLAAYLPQGALEILDKAVEQGIFGSNRQEVARHFLICALHDYSRVERSAQS